MMSDSDKIEFQPTMTNKVLVGLNTIIQELVEKRQPENVRWAIEWIQDMMRWKLSSNVSSKQGMR